MATSSSAKRVYHLVEFQHGDPDDPIVLELYTNWSRNIFGQRGLDYVSRPQISVQLPESTGLLDDKPCKIVLPIPEDGDDFVSDLSSGIAYPPTEVIVTEFQVDVEAGKPTTREIPFRGFVTQTTRNHQGKANMVMIEAVHSLGLLGNVTLGIPATHHCPWRLFSPQCGLDKELHNDNVRVLAIDGREITTDTPAETSIEDYFHRGYVERFGLKIAIREWKKANPTKFKLTRQPPQRWLDSVVSGQAEIVPGCDKTIETCRGRYAPVGGPPAGTTGNEARFGGIGYAMLPYQPQTEGSFSV